MSSRKFLWLPVFVALLLGSNCARAADSNSSSAVANLHDGPLWIVVEKDQSGKVTKTSSWRFGLIEIDKGHHLFDIVFQDPTVEHILDPTLQISGKLNVYYGTSISQMAIPWRDLRIYTELAPIGSLHDEPNEHIIYAEIRGWKAPLNQPEWKEKCQFYCRNGVENPGDYLDYSNIMNFWSNASRTVFEMKTATHSTAELICIQLAAGEDSLPGFSASRIQEIRQQYKNKGFQ